MIATTALRALIWTLAASVLALSAACGGDGDDDDGAADPTSSGPVATSTPAAPEGDDSDGQEPASAPGGGDGVIQLNGESIDVGQVRRCEPFSDAEGNLDLTAIAEGIMLFVVVNQSSAVLLNELSLQGANAGGVFSASAMESGGSWFDEDGAPISGAPFTITGDRISGSMTLNDSRGGTDTADVSFDISIPSEVIDCSL